MRKGRACANKNNGSRAGTILIVRAKPEQKITIIYVNLAQRALPGHNVSN